MTTNSISLVLLVTVLLGAFATEVDARDKRFADRSGSTAFMEIGTQDHAALAEALIQVFADDGYDISSRTEGQVRFSRLASRMQELSYGTPMSPGSLESVAVDFFPLDETTYRVECNVTIISGSNASVADANILPLFGRQYKRMLRRVKRKLR